MLEPEVMDTEDDALEYDAIPNDDVNEAFTDELLGAHAAPVHAVDLGTGPGHIPILLARRHGTVRITGLDLSSNMLKLARIRAARAGLSDRVQFLTADVKTTGLPPASYDLVFSNSTIHHIPEPLTLFREARRLFKGEGLIMFKDLLRPDNLDDVDRLVKQHAAGGTVYQRELFRSSLRASLTLREVRQLADDAGLRSATARQTSDRHWVLTATSSAI
ncbi:MAG TPA: class I SAM-dependent methyltransferase [Kofleriaceae bacterium]